MKMVDWRSEVKMLELASANLFVSIVKASILV